jgi:hypothetical protein
MNCKEILFEDIAASYNCRLIPRVVINVSLLMTVLICAILSKYTEDYAFVFAISTLVISFIYSNINICFSTIAAKRVPILFLTILVFLSFFYWIRWTHYNIQSYPMYIVNIIIAIITVISDITIEIYYNLS